MLKNDEEDFGNNDEIREENDKGEWENSVDIEERDTEERDTEETEKSPNLSPLQTKYSRHLWAGIPVQKVPYIPSSIDRTAVFNVQSKDRLSLLASCRDGRKWKHDSRSQWSGYKTVRYRDCAGSLICKNDTCIFKQNIGERNQMYWDVDGKCVHCHHLPEISTCFARKYIAFVSDTEADVYHYGEHTCRAQLDKEFRPRDNAMAIDMSLTPSHIQGNSIVSVSRDRRSWNEIDQVVSETASFRKISIIRRSFNQMMD